VAIVCRGSEADRALAVALAEGGADVALGTVTPAQQEEFSTASIANEIWAIGREQLNRVIDAADPAAAAAFASEVFDTLGRIDTFVFAAGPIAPFDFDEFSRDEWDPLVTQGLTAAMVCTQAFGRLMEREGGGTIILIDEPAAHGNVAGGVVSEGVRALGSHAGIAWAGRGVRVVVVGRDLAPERASR